MLPSLPVHWSRTSKLENPVFRTTLLFITTFYLFQEQNSIALDPASI